MEKETYLKNKINVSVRVRPAVKREMTTNTFNQCLAVKNNSIYITKLEKTISIDENSVNNNNKLMSYNFSSVFDQTISQNEIFMSIGIKNINSFLNGYNSTIFAYGQTGSGKTYTIEGSKYSDDIKDEGIFPRVIRYLIDYSLTNKSGNDINLKKENINKEEIVKEYFTLSAVQIYIEKINDLLVEKENSTNKNEKELKIYEVFENKNSKSFDIKGLKQIELINKEQAMELVKKAFQNRCVRETVMNEASSRGHIVYCIRYNREIRKNNRVYVRLSKLNIVDLAGSEKISKSGVTSIGLKEATTVNLSLLSLLNVVHSLSNKNSVFKKFLLTETLFLLNYLLTL